MGIDVTIGGILGKLPRIEAPEYLASVVRWRSVFVMIQTGTVDLGVTINSKEKRAIIRHDHLSLPLSLSLFLSLTLSVSL